MAETNKTILLADDSVTIQKVVELTFMDEEFRVASVGNGAEAIAWLGENTPDVVIADVHMPGADGYEVCRSSKEVHPTVPVLLLVGTFETFDSDAASRCGADGHLKKPFDSQDLLRRVRELASASRVASPTAAPPSRSAFEPLPELSPFAAPAEPEEAMWEPLPDEPAPLPDLAPLDFGEDAPTFDSAPSPTSTTAFAIPEPRIETPRFQPVPAPAPPPAPIESAPMATSGPLSDADVDRIARRVIDLLGDKPVRDVAWEVVPDLAEVLLKSRIRELEASVE